ncbi:hypothetical protein MW871_09510 [Flavobacterium sp. I-SCBP12n]|uniref:Uncharacterized protein n=1 Tax=Flavobacterium pygoscelis TaxID=2893176 RepID=A0A9X1XV98_9FLAO|nr:hypothetical protein [Flavobacterium pygoscelis]MCK8142126.1 hypothetical protein [Flavobacterium pygoscelis]
MKKTRKKIDEARIKLNNAKFMLFMILIFIGLYIVFNIANNTIDFPSIIIFIVILYFHQQTKNKYKLLERKDELPSNLKQEK